MSDTTTSMQDLKNRRIKSATVGEKLVAERAEMLVLFCQVAGLAPYEKETDNGLAQQRLQEFCQVLMDYVAGGHFSLYERIIEGDERRQSLADLAEKIYPRIAKTTKIAVAFNDKYDCSDHCEITPDLDNNLSQLGEELAVRAELEDQLLNEMMR